MEDFEIEYLKQMLKDHRIIWRSVDGDTFECSAVKDDYKESWEEISSPVVFFKKGGGYVDLLNTELFNFYVCRDLEEIREEERWQSLAV